ncbi:MAG: glycoside hydrolase family 9 protein [Halioglobus sp.]|nr:glycoside hydrolase family 9 protein [Halioglobus sp.]
MHRLDPLLILILTLASLSASDVRSVSLVAPDVICVHYDDGHVDYKGFDKDWPATRFWNKPLNARKAADPATFTLQGSDKAYRTGRNPLAVGRKAKGTDFVMPAIWGTVSKDDESIQEHWVYLQFPEPLTSGADYTLDLGGTANNHNQVQFTLNELTLRTPLIHVNQVGFATNSPKYAYLSQWMGDFNHAPHRDGGLDLSALDGQPFLLLPWGATSLADAVFEGRIEKRKKRTDPDSRAGKDKVAKEAPYGKHGNFTFADVWQCDFSSFTTAGEYMVVVPGVGRSFSFEVGDNALRDAYYAASRGLFAQRSGVDKEMWPGYVWRRSHHPDDVVVFYNASDRDPTHHGRFKHQGQPRLEDVWGYYHDAGDWDKYIRHDQITFALLLLYQLKPENFADGDIGNRYRVDGKWIEEGENGIPDLLDEARWQIDFYRRARAELKEKGLGSGGCPGGYTGQEGGANARPSWMSKRPWSVSAEHPDATYNYAGMAALYAKQLSTLDAGKHSKDIALYSSEAEEAFAWAEKNKGGDEYRALSAACLYALTGEGRYQQAFKQSFAKINRWLPTAGSRPWEQAAAVYALLPDDHAGLDRGLRDGLVRKSIVDAADGMVNPVERRGFRFAMAWKTNYMLGSHSTPRVHMLAYAYGFTGKQKYLDGVHTTVAYFLGGNETNTVWVTGLGEKPTTAVFHLDSFYAPEFDLNSMVYSNPIIDGLTHYYSGMRPWVGPKGAGYEPWGWLSAYPKFTHDSWPKGEARFENRWSIAGSEFTVSQQNLHTLFAYGYVAGPAPAAYEPYTVRPELKLAKPQISGTTLNLRVSASDNTRRVVYYCDWHPIGESFAADDGFMLKWDRSRSAIASGSATITAVGYNHSGYQTWPQSHAEQRIELP